MRRLSLLTLVLVLALPGVALAQQPSPSPSATAELDAYEEELTQAEVLELRRQGFDPLVLGDGAEPGTVRVEVVASSDQAPALAKQGFDRTGAADAGIRAQDDEPAGDGVFRPFSGEGGLEQEMRDLAAANPELVELVQYGESVRGQPLLALRVTRDVQEVEQGERPASLYLAAQHAREWITPEMVRRLTRYMVENADTGEVNRLLGQNEFWFIWVANPDGYDYTFSDQRLWRKNLADNDGDGEITGVDGVDLNRNFPTNWGYDNEGSSPNPSSQVYRGPAPASEPETQGLNDLARRLDFNFLINYHSAAELLLYGVGWQVQTPTPDDHVYRVLTGTDEQPAVPGYDPDLSAELYITNGDTTDHMHERLGILAITPEMSTCQTISNRYDDDEWVAEDCLSGFNFPDDEELIAEEFENNLPFALDVARSTRRPGNPVSHQGLTAPDFVVDDFAVSYGSPQTVAADVRRVLGTPVVDFRVNGGEQRTTFAREWDGGEVYGSTNDVYYRHARAEIRGPEPGDTVEYRFRAGGRRGEWYSYTVAQDTGNEVLVVAAEDYTGLVPEQEDGPSAAPAYLQAIADAGYSADLYDIDANDRTAPHPLGVLDHYEVVVTETGADLVPRAPGQPRGTLARYAAQLELNLRDFVNEGGRLLYAGADAGFASAANGAYQYAPEDASLADPSTTAECGVADASCLPVLDDFLQYWLGAWDNVRGGGVVDGDRLDLAGVDVPYREQSYELSDVPEGEEALAQSFLTTSSFLPPEDFPQFTSRDVLDYDREGGGRYEPFSGEYALFSEQADRAYRRFGRTIDVADSGASVDFKVSYDVESNWDYWFVEVHPVGSDEWTTLPISNDEGELTTQETGNSCAAGWIEQLHPFLSHYQTPTEDGCDPTGTTGEWHAVTGTSDGWVDASVDLSAYAGQEVEVSITYATDWGTQGLGILVDDLRVLAGGEVVDETSFEDGLGTWQVLDAPEGSAAVTAESTWQRSTTLYEEGAAIATDDTLYFGFGLEMVEGEEARAEVMARALRYLFDDTREPPGR